MRALRLIVLGGTVMRNELTEKDIKKIDEEIEYRKLVVRKEAIEAVKEARAQGDLSENFEYYAAKKAKNKNESRIRYLETISPFFASIQPINVFPFVVSALRVTTLPNSIAELVYIRPIGLAAPPFTLIVKFVPPETLTSR